MPSVARKPRQSWMIILSTLVLPLALIYATGHTARAAAPRTSPVAVTIENFAFSPATLHVAPGTTVTWTNKDSAPHTVSSLSGAWTDSGTLSDGKTFSYTFTKAGTYQYHCAIHATMTGSVTVGTASSVPVTQAGTSATGSMGPMQMTMINAFSGYYDGKVVKYLSTDTSNKAEAARSRSNYAPSLAKSLAQANAIYLVTNGPFAARGAVFSSVPGNPGYSPLWQEVLVTWKDPAQATALGSDNQVLDLAKRGTLSLKSTGIVLNCPIIG